MYGYNHALSDVLEWKYGCVANTKQIGPDEFKITKWNHPTLPKPTTKQLKEDFAEYDAYIIAQNESKIDFKEKHRDSKLGTLSDADVIEWAKHKMAQELGINA